MTQEEYAEELYRQPGEPYCDHEPECHLIDCEDYLVGKCPHWHQNP